MSYLVKTYVYAKGYTYIHTVRNRLLTIEKIYKADLPKNHILWFASWKTSGKRSNLTKESHEREEFGAAEEFSK